MDIVFKSIILVENEDASGGQVQNFFVSFLSYLNLLIERNIEHDDCILVCEEVDQVVVFRFGDSYLED